MILNTFLALLLIYTFITGALATWKNASWIFMAYTNRLKDWFLAILTLFCVIVLGIFLEIVFGETFFGNSIYSFFGRSEKMNIVNSGVMLELHWALVYFAFFATIIPILAYQEEIVFRKKVNKIRNNVIFGLVHLIMGIPIYASIILIFVGFVYQWQFDRVYKRTQDENVAYLASTSLHAKYNFTIVMILVLAMIFGG